MNLMIDADELGFTPTFQVEQELLDGRSTRVFKGTGTNLIPVPGCLEITAVRMPGLLLESERIDEVPLDGSEHPRFLAIRRKIYRLIKSIDGTPLLQRASCSNDGIWQKGADVYVTGTWDEEISPPLPEPVTVPEVSHRRVGLEVGGPMPDAATRGRGRPPQVAEPAKE